jgi:hypothetical protein
LTRREPLINKVTEREKEFSIEGWHVRHDQAREALKAMSDTHQVNVLAIWDHKARLVKPQKYERMLRGAIVVVTFKLKLRNTTDGGGGTRRRRFYLEISSVLLQGAHKVARNREGGGKTM